MTKTVRSCFLTVFLYCLKNSMANCSARSGLPDSMRRCSAPGNRRNSAPFSSANCRAMTGDAVLSNSPWIIRSWAVPYW